MTIRYEETVAKQILEMVFPGAQMEYRSEQSNGEYDFDLRYPNDEIAAVEVTSSRDQALTQIHAEIFKRKGGSGITAARCKMTWYVFPRPDAEINKIRNEADKYLADLEEEQIESFDWFDCSRGECPACIVTICNDLRLNRGVGVQSSGTPQIRIQGVVSGAAVGPTTATRAGEGEAEANRVKLGKAKTTERHLFVYIDQMNGSAFTALTSFEPPPVPPNLPAEITHIWLATETQKDNFVLWRGASGEHWSRVEFSPASGQPTNILQGLKPI